MSVPLEIGAVSFVRLTTVGVVVSFLDVGPFSEVPDPH
jgi:hypothetical protein